MAQFTIRFPMYAIAKSPPKEASSGTDASSRWYVLNLSGDDGTSLKCIPVFTSQDSVQGYRSARLPQREVWPTEMPGAVDLNTFLNDAQATAITHVLFDPVQPDGSMLLEPVPVELVMDTLRRTGAV